MITIKQDPNEIIFNRVLELDPMSPHYFSDLFAYSMILMDEQDLKELENRLFVIRGMFTKTGQVPSLMMVERMILNRDPNDFVKIKRIPYGHDKLYIYQVEDKFNELRVWVFKRLNDLKKQIRFSKTVI